MIIIWLQQIGKIMGPTKFYENTPPRHKLHVTSKKARFRSITSRIGLRKNENFEEWYYRLIISKYTMSKIKIPFKKWQYLRYSASSRSQWASEIHTFRKIFRYFVFFQGFYLGHFKLRPQFCECVRDIWVEFKRNHWERECNFDWLFLVSENSCHQL